MLRLHELLQLLEHATAWQVAWHLIMKETKQVVAVDC